MLKTKYILPFFLVIQILLVKIMGLFPDFVETVYSKGLYPKLNLVLRKTFGGLPFSFGDLLYLLLIGFIIHWMGYHRRTFFKQWRNNGLALVSGFSVVYFFFHVLWGLNYYRIPLQEKLHIEKVYSKHQLELFTEKMLLKTNELHVQITKNDTVAVKIPYTDEEIYTLAVQGYKKLPSDLRDYSYEHKSIKTSLFSLPLSYMGFGGYVNPFTHEAQINNLKPKYTSPLTTCHEMAHQTGIGSESDCNFIGFITATKNDDLYFQYSAYSFALRYALTNLEGIEHGSSKIFADKINKGVLKNYYQSELFWNAHQTPLNTFFEHFYDTFLKANQQKEGMESYSKFIGLVIGYDQK